MKKYMYGLWVLTVLAFTFVAPFAASAAATKITFKNTTSKKVSVALMYSSQGADSTTETKGWWNVEPGESRTITWPGHEGPYVVGSMSYYAKAQGLVWSGKNGEDWIHPSKSFAYSSWYNEGEHVKGEPASGRVKVKFRDFEIKRLKDGNVGATVTLSTK
jgi:hypothetical protein